MIFLVSCFDTIPFFIMVSKIINCPGSRPANLNSPEISAATAYYKYSL